MLALPCSAEAQSVHLRWSSPAASMCPNGTTLRDDVQRLTGQRFVTDPQQAEVRVVGRIEQDELEVRALLEAHTADGSPMGTRELRASADDCAALRRPLAMVLALLLEQPPQRHRVGFAIGAELAGDTHLMPRTTGGVGVMAMLTPRPRLGLRLSGDYWWPVVAETSAGAGARLQGVGGSVSLCPRLKAGARIGLWLCLGTQAGALRASPRGLTTQRAKTLAFADLLAELALSVRAGRGLTVWASGGPLCSLARPELFFARADGLPERIQRASSVGAVFRLSLTIGGQ
jgi:hypothetical protein